MIKMKAMKKILIVLTTFFCLQACSNNSGESGAVNDGIKGVDSNGGLADTPYKTPVSPQTDTAKMEDRVDIEKRDTLKHK
jgi:hypothetical protein